MTEKLIDEHQITKVELEKGMAPGDRLGPFPIDFYGGEPNFSWKNASLVVEKIGNAFYHIDVNGEPGQWSGVSVKTAADVLERLGRNEYALPGEDVKIIARRSEVKR